MLEPVTGTSMVVADMLSADSSSGGAGVPLRELLLVGLTAAAITYLLTSLVLSLIHI